MSIYNTVRCCLSFVAVVLFATQASAIPIQLGGGFTVTCSMVVGANQDESDTCTQALVNPLTFVIPEPALVNNVEASEPAILLKFNVLFQNLGLGVRNILDPTDANNNPCPQVDYVASCISDTVQFTNFPNGQVAFLSNPNPFINSVGFDPRKSLPVGCVEGPFGGCSFVYTVNINGGSLLFNVFSDGNFVIPSPNSDGISVSFVPVPEPASIVLMGCGLVGLVARRQRWPRFLRQGLRWIIWGLSSNGTETPIQRASRGAQQNTAFR